VAIVEGGAVPRRRAADRDDVCERLESSGWTVEAAWPVAVPLALIPFDPVRVPKTVLAYLYACHPEIETYCFLLQARRSRRPTPARAPAADRLPPAFPTIPWRTEGEWRELAEERPGACAPPEPAPTLPAPAPWGDDELIRIKSSLAWRAVVRYRVTRDRLLPPETRRGRLYARALSAIVRGAVNGHRGP
jgi:hypothetical protein